MTTVLLLTNPDYTDFLLDVTRDYVVEHEICISDEKYIVWDDPDWSYDIGISFMYRYKVPAEQVNSKPWFNFHPAPLPEYRGRDLCYHAIMNGEKEFGATIHYMDENFDTGDIIEVKKFDIKHWWTAEELSNQAKLVSQELFVKYLPLILENTEFPRIPNVGGTYYKKGSIVDTVPISVTDPVLARWIRAVTYGDFHPRIYIGGVSYRIVREK